MQDINIKFKDSPPDVTVAQIQQILASMNIGVTEHWNDSGVENCWSLNLTADGATPLAANGKGITKELARASAYGEFIERLQCGLMLYKYQSITRDPALSLENYAPDAKYVTTQELIDNGEWMEPIIQAYGNNLTREKIAKLCRTYACTEEDSIRIVPYYSVFEDKYVYLPTGFAEQMYASNGCCAGNTREEAWIHALSEILERHNTFQILTGNQAVPEIPDSVICRFPIAAKILENIRNNDALDITFLDFSLAFDFPVIATRIINKFAHSYRINVCADPILEIAIDRTLTETFQGQTLKSIGASHSPSIYEERANLSVSHNVINQLEQGNGLFGMEFFISTADEAYTGFTDHSNKTNKELLDHVLSIYKAYNLQVYVRNYSFLGFHTYRMIVPGFSEARSQDLFSPIHEYALGDRVHTAFRNPTSASDEDLLMMLSFYKRISSVVSKKSNFRVLAGLPMETSNNRLLTAVTLAYAAYRLKNYQLCAEYLKPLCSLESISAQEQDYFSCICRYLKLQQSQIPQEKISALLNMFYPPASVEKLESSLQQRGHPFQEFLLQCNTATCGQCRYRSWCAYDRCRTIYASVGNVYHTFTNGQQALRPDQAQ